MPGPKVPSQSIREFAARLDAIDGARARAAAKREFAATYGISAATLSRALLEIGVRCHERSDAGARRAPVDDDTLHRIAALQRASNSLRKGVVMPAERAIIIAEDSGWIARGVLKPNWYNRWLRDHEASRRDQQQPEPHVELRSLGPNHVHQVDFSLAVNWKMASNGRFQYEHLIYKNKLPSAGEPRLLRLLLVDHASSCFSVHYTASTGETVQALLAGLYTAWTEKRIAGRSIKQQYPFRGVPRILMADRGSANRAGVTTSLLDRLDVQLNICEGARSKGAVEQSHGWWESHFESCFRLQQPESVEQLNDWAMDFAARISAEKAHTRHGSPRSSMWLWHVNRRPETQLRELACDYATFCSIALSDPQRCVIGGARIVRFKGNKYRVPEDLVPGDHAIVQYSPFYFPQVLVRRADDPESPAWCCEPVELDEFGFAASAPIIGQEYRAQKQTETRRFVLAAEAAARELAQDHALRIYGHHADRVRPTAAREAAEEIAVEPEAPVYLTRIQARQQVLEARGGRPFSSAERDYLASVFGDQVTPAEVETAIAAIEAGVHAKVLAFREAL
jgi:hypothetical protein